MALSKTQNRRLGMLLSVMFMEDLTEDDLQEVINDQLVEEKDGNFKVTEKGLSEKNRLCTLAGLNIKYSSEKNAKT